MFADIQQTKRGPRSPSVFMSDALFVLGRAAVYLTTLDSSRGVLRASKEVRAEVLAHIEVVELQSASDIGRGLPGSLKGGSKITGNCQEIPMEVEIPGNMGKRCRAGLRRG